MAKNLEPTQGRRLHLGYRRELDTPRLAGSQAPTAASPPRALRTPPSERSPMFSSTALRLILALSMLGSTLAFAQRPGACLVGSRHTSGDSGGAPSPDLGRSSEVATQFSSFVEGSETLTIRVQGGRMSVHCPIGVRCDENYHYWALQHRSDEGHLYISFDPSVLRNVTEQSLRENFRYLNFQSSVTGLPEGWMGALANRSPIERFESLEYRNGRLRLEVLAPAGSGVMLSGADRDEDRCPPIADAPMPPGCYVSTQMRRPVRVIIELEIPTQGRDCTNAGLDSSCG